MAQATYPAPVLKIIGDTLALSTTAGFFQFLPKAYQFNLFCPTTAFRLSLCPAIKDVNFYDASASLGSRFVKNGSNSSLKNDLTDKASGTGTGTVLDSMQTDDFLYVCLSDVVGGVHFTIKSANGTSSTIQATYWDGSAWAALTEADNTDSGGATLAVTGSITFTAPTDWVRAILGGANGILRDDNSLRADVGPVIDVRYEDPSMAEGHWIRFAVGTALDSDTEVEELMSVNRGDSRGRFRSDTEISLSVDRRFVGNFEIVSASVTPTLEINSLITGY